MQYSARLSVILILLFVDSATAQVFNCPPGSVNVGSGYQIMCQCPDGSFLGAGGCRSQAPPQPQGIRCGSGYCPFGTTCSRYGNFCLQQDQVDCGTYTCSFGNKCASGNRCFPLNAKECGAGYCVGGLICSRNQKCIDPTAAQNSPIGEFGTLLSDLGLRVSTGIPNLNTTQSVSDSIKSRGDPPMSWMAIQAQQQMLGQGPGPGMSPGNGLSAPANFNPFTNSYSIPNSNNAAPNFQAPPVQPQLQAAVQATKPVVDNLHDIGSIPVPPAPSQQNNSPSTWQNPDPYNTHCTGAFTC